MFCIAERENHHYVALGQFCAHIAMVIVGTRSQSYVTCVKNQNASINLVVAEGVSGQLVTRSEAARVTPWKLVLYKQKLRVKLNKTNGAI